MHVALVNDATDAVVGSDSFLVAGDGVISSTFTDLMTKGGTYRVDYYADFNSGGGTVGVCDVLYDHMWSIAVTDVAGDGTNDVTDGGTASAVNSNVTITRPHDTAFTPAACTSF